MHAAIGRLHLSVTFSTSATLTDLEPAAPAVDDRLEREAAREQRLSSVEADRSRWATGLRYPQRLF
jgi:hypothetical protein